MLIIAKVERQHFQLIFVWQENYIYKEKKVCFDLKSWFLQKKSLNLLDR